MDPEDVRRRWAERSGEFSPAYYAHYGPDETSERVRAAVERAVGPDAAVLELGCGPGRHLAHLHDHGFDDLTGVDVNPDAFDVMAEAYPDLAAAATVHAGAIEDVLGRFDDGGFGAVFSVETLQHVHPDDAWVFGEVARVTDEALVTVENEGGPGDGPSPGDVTHVDDGLPLYYRNWGNVFAGAGLEEVESARLDRDTLRVFRPR